MEKWRSSIKMFIILSINPSMKLSLSEDFVSNIIVIRVILKKSCCRHILFMNLSEFDICYHQSDISKILKVPFGFLFSGKVWYCSWNKVCLGAFHKGFLVTGNFAGKEKHLPLCGRKLRVLKILTFSSNLPLCWVYMNVNGMI